MEWDFERKTKKPKMSLAFLEILFWRVVFLDDSVHPTTTDVYINIQ